MLASLLLLELFLFPDVLTVAGLPANAESLVLLVFKLLFAFLLLLTYLLSSLLLLAFVLILAFLLVSLHTVLYSEKY